MTKRRSEQLAGLLFFIATGTFFAGNAILSGVFEGVDFIEQISGKQTLIQFGSVLQLMNSAAIIGIGIFLYPSIKEYSEKMAIGYLISRVLESAILFVGVVGPLLLIPLSYSDIEVSTTVVKMLIHWNLISFQVGMIGLGIFSVFFCYFMWSKKMIPRVLSISGILGYVSLLVSANMEIQVTGSGLMFLMPGALFEIAFPIWLIFKGVQPYIKS